MLIKNFNSRRRTLVAAAIFSLAPLGIYADGVLMYDAKTRPDPAEIAKVLSGQATVQVRSRGVRLLDDNPTGAINTATVYNTKPDGPALQPGDPIGAFAVQINFDFDSSRLNKESTELLDAVAEGLKMVDSSISIVVEGHTDSRGTDTYNIGLSSRRADAVAKYFQRNHKLASNRFRVVGKGKSEPLNLRDTAAAENRRVQFRAVAG